MEGADPYTFYCDVYSFGVVVFELLSGQLPYPNIQERDLVSMMRRDSKLGLLVCACYFVGCALLDS